MSGSTASASANSGAAPRELVVSVNWIGDAIMAMPALQLYRHKYPNRHLAVLARGALADLWAMHEAPNQIIRYQGRPDFFHPVFGELRSGGFDAAWILPNSFRSAWTATRGGIRRRIGFGGGLRSPLINDRRAPLRDERHIHQAWEYLQLFSPDELPDEIPAPRLKVPDMEATKFPAPAQPVIGLIPGAARGPAKRWPPEHFIALAQRLVADGFALDVFGGPDDRELGSHITAAVGGPCRNLCGQTSIAEWAELMARCQLVVANDSGGMHLAAALGRPLIALYGITDPARTGPLGEHCVIMQKSHHRSRDIARDSEEARKSLASIKPEDVYEKSIRVLSGGQW
ncbi:MAG: lipopolysaccharide heptosyltransferase II [Kiritimatiellia bacterium]